MLDQELQKIGLSDKEAGVYLATLELGSAPVQNISEKAKINRATTYVALQGLIEKGLISQLEKNRRRYFIAENPDKLDRIFQQKEMQLKKEQESVFGLMPELKALFNFGSLKPKVRYYEGVNGINNILDEILDSNPKIIKGFTNLDDLHQYFPNHNTDYSERRIKKGINSRALYTCKKGPIQNATDPKRLRKALFIPMDQYPLGADITLAGDKIMMVSFYKDPIIGIIIEDKGMATTIDTLFELSWITAKKQNK